jgi:N6-L-threonylcarbamoyladenine synthase
LAEEISSQVELHQDYGGVVPELAAREHMRNLPLLVDKLLGDRGLCLKDCGAIAVTRGPGLKGCLLMGVCFAKGVAVATDTALVGVNHIEGHLLAPLMDNPDLGFPFLALVVSGGHTEIVEVRGLGDYVILARTIDDAAGEAFDKSANLLGFGYPGGAGLAALADARQSSRFKLPRVMRRAKGFSFSGLKTAVAVLVKQHQANLDDPSIKGELAYAIQDAIVDALCFKLKQAIKASGIRRVAVSGGVSANQCLRLRIREMKGVSLYLPSFGHCMDNAAMIGHVGAWRYARGDRMPLDADVLSRWPVEEIA